MRVKDYKCKCGHDDFFFGDKGNQTGIYCSYCGKWLKWADKDEQNLSMKQEPKTGHWIYEKRKRLMNETDEGAEYITDYWCKCSNCGGDFGYIKMKDAFCKYCGAKMVQESEDKVKIEFTKDFANNWEAGEIVEARYLGMGKILVDNVAEVDVKQLLEHCKIISESEG